MSLAVTSEAKRAPVFQLLALIALMITWSYRTVDLSAPLETSAIEHAIHAVGLSVRPGKQVADRRGAVELQFFSQLIIRNLWPGQILIIPDCQLWSRMLHTEIDSIFRS